MFKNDAKQIEHELKAEIKELKADQEKHKTQIDNLYAGINELRRENKKLTDKLRQQTKADILLNALEVVGIVKSEPDKDHFAESIRLQNQLGDIQKQSQPRSSLIGGVLSGFSRL